MWRAGLRRWRFRGDASEPDGGWTGTSADTAVRTAEPTGEAVILRSRVPRIHLRQAVGFRSNSAQIKRGAEALPEIARLMLENPDMTLGIEGHVNFGQSESAGMRLSEERADEIVRHLVAQGVDPDRMVASGCGWSRPRFPRASQFAGRNRRVEFRILPGSPLYERLSAEAAERHRAVNSAHPDEFAAIGDGTPGQPASDGEGDDEETATPGDSGAGAGAGAGADDAADGSHD